MAPKGMSTEEKQKTILTILHMSQDVYNMAEIEKMASAMGVRLDTVKENVGILVSDKLVLTDKIGSGNFYWSFPSSDMVRLNNTLAQSTSQIAVEEAQIAALEAKHAQLSAANKDAEAVTAAVEELRHAKATYELLATQVQALADSDPAIFEVLKEAAKQAKVGCDQWTENLFAARAWLVRKMEGRTAQEIDKMMGIPANFDFMD